MEEFNQSIKKIRNVFAKITIAIIAITGLIAIFLLIVSGGYFFKIFDLDGGSVTAGLEFVVYILMSLIMLVLIALAVIFILIIPLVILWSIYGIIYVVKKKKVKDLEEKNIVSTNLETTTDTTAIEDTSINPTSNKIDEATTNDSSDDT